MPCVCVCVCVCVCTCLCMYVFVYASHDMIFVHPLYIQPRLPSTSHNAQSAVSVFQPRETRTSPMARPQHPIRSKILVPLDRPIPIAQIISTPSNPKKEQQEKESQTYRPTQPPTNPQLPATYPTPPPTEAPKRTPDADVAEIQQVPRRCPECACERCSSTCYRP